MVRFIMLFSEGRFKKGHIVNQTGTKVTKVQPKQVVVPTKPHGNKIYGSISHLMNWLERSTFDGVSAKRTVAFDNDVPVVTALLDRMPRPILFSFTSRLRMIRR
jgi:hypothetical protein